MAGRIERVMVLLYGLVACLVTGAAAMLAFGITHSSLGAGGGILAGIGAAMLVGGLFFVVGAAIWAPRSS